MHLGWAYLIVFGTVSVLNLKWYWRALCYFYPRTPCSLSVVLSVSLSKVKVIACASPSSAVMMLLSIMVTGNHWFLDGVAGFLVVELSYAILLWTDNYSTIVQWWRAAPAPKLLTSSENVAV